MAPVRYFRPVPGDWFDGMASFGETLRRERELRGVSLREIADATKISMRFLQALEQDRLDVLPGGVFQRSFVRQYARFLGLDPERLLADFVHAHGADAVETVTRHAERSGPHHSLYLLAVFALVLVPLLGTKIWRERVRTDAARAVATPAAPVQRVYQTPAPAAAAEETAPDGSAAPDGIALTLSAKERCWVAVQADGHTILDRVLAQGETETVQAQGELVLSVGNAGGISFTVGDRPGVSLGRSGEVRRNIVITRESLPSLVQDAPPPLSSHRS
jgi:cytoskeleton protein RodZ